MAEPRPRVTKGSLPFPDLLITLSLSGNMAPFLHHHIVPGFIQKRITSFIHTHNSQEGSSYTRKQKPENGNFYSSVTSLVQLKHNASILGLFRETGPTGIYAQKHTHTYIYTHLYSYTHTCKQIQIWGGRDSDWG